MVFRKCSIGGRVYNGDSNLLDGQTATELRRSEQSGNERVSEQVGEVVPDTISAVRYSESSTAAGSGATKQPLTLPKPIDVKLSKGVLGRFHDATLAVDIEEATRADPTSENASHARSINGFFTVLSLCHTVLADVEPETGVIEYKAQSPDEAALVQAASDMGFTFLGRDRETLKLRTPFSDEVERYELLDILEFTSARKRMSVVVRKMGGIDGRLFLLTKGADNVIFERLRPGGDDLKAITEQQLADFARDGLRTLTLAYKVIPGERWAHSRIHHALIIIPT
jgi:phospholipid-translocating ATPase